MKFLPLVLANLKRHKLRTILTICSVALALFLFASLRTVTTTLTAGSEVSSASRMIVQNATAFVIPLPMSYAQRLKIGAARDQEVTWANWFGGKYGDGKKFFAQFAIDPESVPQDVSGVHHPRGAEAGVPQGAFGGARRRGADARSSAGRSART